MSIEFDFSAFERMLGATEKNVMSAAESGMGEAAGALLNDSRNLAPLDKGTLRQQAWSEVTEEGGVIAGEVYYSVTEQGESRNRGNYALYQHELAPYDNPTTPGTGPKFLERPLKQNYDQYMKIAADTIRKELS